MKLSGRSAAAYFAKPDPDRAGLLIYGADSMRVSLKRSEAVSALIGPKGDEEMRLTRMSGADLKKDPALLQDAVKAKGFFPGYRVAMVEEAADALAGTIAAALNDWVQGDAHIVVTAGALRANSKLRKLFETHDNAYAAGLYDDPPSRSEIEAALRKSEITSVSEEAMAALTDLANALGPGDLVQTINKLGLYMLDNPAAVSAEDVAAVSPASTEVLLDDILTAAAEGHPDKIGPLTRRLQSQGVQPVTLCIGALRHFRLLYSLSIDPGGAAHRATKLRPPVFGARRDALVSQARRWGADRLETALEIVADTDLKLRSAGQRAPAMALVERCLIRLAMLTRSRSRPERANR